VPALLPLIYTEGLPRLALLAPLLAPAPPPAAPPAPRPNSPATPQSNLNGRQTHESSPDPANGGDAHRHRAATADD
jgi:hypothetical protein